MGYDPKEYLPPEAEVLSDAEMNLVVDTLSGGSYATYADQHTICERGDAGDKFWLILKGEVRVALGDGAYVTRKPREIVGEQALFTPGGTRSATMSAIGTVELLAISATVLAGSTDLSSAWLRLLSMVLSAKLRQATNERADQSARIAAANDLLARFVSRHSLSKVRTMYLTGKDAGAAQFFAIVLFSDLVGFGKFALGAEDPTQVACTLRSLMQSQANAMSSYGTDIDKYMGDGIMAFWVVEAENQLAEYAVPAIQAASDAIAAVSAEAASQRIEIALRVGLHCGPVISGNFGTDDRIAHTLIGETVNTAARYEQAKQSVDGEELEALRISPAIHSLLPANLQAQFEGPTNSQVKHGQEITVFHARTIINAQ